MKDMKYYIFTCDEENFERPLTNKEGKVIEFEDKKRAEIFLEAIKSSKNIFDEEFNALIDNSYVKNCILFYDIGYVDANCAEKEIFGGLLSEEKGLLYHLEKFLDDKYLNKEETGYEEYMLYGHESTDWEDIRINEATEKFFKDIDFDEDKYNIVFVQVIDSISMDAYALAISWIEYGKLNSVNIPVYTY